MIIGFTGTQHGMTQIQLEKLYHFLEQYNPSKVSQVHHGDCIGSDSQFHDICQSMGFNIYIHPPKNENKRAFKTGYVEIYEKKDYLVRNKVIVNCCDLLIATPAEVEEILRSGTWSTIRYARKLRKQVVILPPY